MNLIGLDNDYTNEPSDVRQRIAFNGLYQLPFGVGKAHLNNKGISDVALGGWTADLQFSAQAGIPISIGIDSTAPVGGTAHAVMVGDPFALGGTPPAGNLTSTCATKVKTVQHWYNPCAFTNPPAYPAGVSQVAGIAALPYLGGKGYNLRSPGFNVVNMSVFKTLWSFHERTPIEFRADIFNVLNTPAYGAPSTATDGPTGGQITATRAFQSFTPDSRVAQLALKMEF
jgi:hypothetical protein